MVDLLIIGKQGQLGSALVQIAKENKLNFKAYSKIELNIGDFETSEIIIKRINPKIIINTSAYHHTPLCEKNPLNAFEINSIAVFNLAKLAKEINAKFITYSTNYVFDGVKNNPYLESDIPNPLQMYGLSKFAGEIASLNEYPKGTLVIRTCGVYGGGKKGSRSKGGNYILKILKESNERKIIYASTKQIVNPTYSLDLARGTIDLLNLNPSPGIYHLVNEGACSWLDFTKMILDYRNIKVKVKPIKEQGSADFKRPNFSALKNLKAKKLGVILPTIDQGLQAYLKEI